MKTAVISLAAAALICLTGVIYPSAAVITALDYDADTVTVETSTGFVYTFPGCEDYTEGDIVCLIMYDVAFDGLIYNDTVISACYSGYCIRGAQILH